MVFPLFIAAFDPELAALDAGLPRAAIGVGLVEASLGMARTIAAHRPARVVLVGTAGAYPNSQLAIGDVVVAERVVLASPSGALVLAMPSAVNLDRNLASSFDARLVVVATTLAITTEDAIAAQLERDHSADVEHLEAFAVARACAIANVPLAIVLGIANIVGSSGRAEWTANHIKASAAACAVAIRNPTTAP